MSWRCRNCQDTSRRQRWGSIGTGYRQRTQEQVWKLPQCHRWGDFEIPLVSSVCQKLLLCQRPGYIQRSPTEPPWIRQSLEGSVVKLSLHIAHQCCWEASRTCSTVLEKRLPSECGDWKSQRSCRGGCGCSGSPQNTGGWDRGNPPWNGALGTTQDGACLNSLLFSKSHGGGCWITKTPLAGG
ncbi:hypothetical protein Nmel_018858 [Mimus melanotis]